MRTARALPVLALPMLTAMLTAMVTVLVVSGPAAQARTWAVPKTQAETAPASLPEFETQLMVEINQARQAHGLRRIAKFDSCTDRMAERWGQRIVTTGAFEHRDQQQVIRRCRTSWAGETLIRGSKLTPESMVSAWLDSPGHRVILLNKRAELAGVSVSRDPQGRLVGVLNVVRPR